LDTLNKILDELVSQGKTQKELSNLLGLNKNTLTDWKNGKSHSYKKYINEIAKFLDVSVDSLLGNTDIKNKPAVQENDELSDNIKIIVEKLKQLDKDNLKLADAYLDFLLSRQRKQ